MAKQKKNSKKRKLSSAIKQKRRESLRRHLIENLENRQLLTTFNVTTLDDRPDARPGDGHARDIYGHTTLRSAITEANSQAGPHRINLPAGTYQLSIPGVGNDTNCSGDFDLNGDITLAGAGPGATRIQGNSLDRVLDISGNVSLQDLTVTGGRAPGPGQFGNGYGGGIRVSEGNVSLENVVVSGNHGAFGTGGISNRGHLTINNSTITGNSTPYAAGALWVWGDGTASITNSTISGNSADNGGGIAADGNVLVTLTNTTITGNVARYGGGGLRLNGGAEARLLNNIIAGNTAGNEGPDILSYQGSGKITSLGNNLVGKSAGASGLVASDLKDVDAKLGPLSDNGGETFSHAPQADSPALDAGSFTGAPEADQRGVARPSQGTAGGQDRIDIGAIEVANQAPVARNDAYQVDRGNVLKSDNVSAVEQDFSSDPEWTSHGNNQGGNEFGYQDGKIGGRFTRSSSARHYGDTNLASPISFDLPFSASGSFRAADINHPDFGNGMMFGHFTVGGPGEGVQNGPFKVGIGLTDNSQGNVLWWYGGILDNSGLAMDAVGHVVLELKSDHEWSYNWNPEGGQGHGSLTVTLDGKASTLELSQQQRQMLTGSMNAFGLAGNPASHPNSGKFADISIDNVSYTSSQGQGVLANDSDPDGDAIESHLVRDVQHGTLSLAKDGTFTYTPDDGFHGKDSFTYVAHDGRYESNVATVEIEVICLNQAPVAVNDSYEVDENSTLTTQQDSYTHSFDLRSDAGRSPYRVSNASLLRESFSPYVYYWHPNQLNEWAEVVYKVDVPFTIDSADSLKAGQHHPGYVSVYNGHSDANFDPNARGYFEVSVDDQTWHTIYESTPEEGIKQRNEIGDILKGTSSFYVRGRLNASRRLSCCGLSQFFRSVPESNSFPTIKVYGKESILANDSDPDGDSLTAQLVSNVSHGDLKLNDDGSFTYTPKADYDGPDSFTYQAFDGTDVSNVATVNINVQNVNQAPVSAGDSYSLNRNETLTVSDAGQKGVLANDSDPDGDSLAAILVRDAQHGKVELKSDGTFTYTPENGFHGADSFAYVAHDGYFQSDVATVTLEVICTNEAPVAVDDLYTAGDTTSGGVLAPVQRSEIFENDPNWTGVLNTAHGNNFGFRAGDSSDSGRAGGVFSRSASDGYYADTNLLNDLSLNDNLSASGQLDIKNIQFNGMVSIGFIDTTSNARFGWAIAESHEGSNAVRAFTYAILKDGSQQCSQPLLLTNVTDAPRSWTFEYDPAANNGNGEIVFSIEGSSILSTNGVGDCNTLTTQRTVSSQSGSIAAEMQDGQKALGTALNAFGMKSHKLSSPSANLNIELYLDDLNYTAGATRTVLANDSDPDGDALTARLVKTTEHGQLDLRDDGSFTYAPSAGFMGTDSFTYQAFDGNDLSNVATVTIDVHCLNKIPTLDPISAISADSGFGEIGIVGAHSRGHALSGNRFAVTSSGSNNENSWQTTIHVFKSDGTPDANFGNNGIVKVNLSGKDLARGLHEQRDGKLLLPGTVNYGYGGDHWGLTRLNADGSLDTTFGTGGSVTLDVATFGQGDSATSLADGTIVMVGKVHNSRKLGVVRFDSNGNADTSFGEGGLLTIDLGNSRDNSASYSQVFPGNNGSVWVKSGREYQAASPRQTMLFKIDTDGTVSVDSRTSIGEDGHSDNAFIDHHGRVTVAGSIDGDLLLIRYNADGSLDSSFASNGIARHDYDMTDSPAVGIAEDNGTLLVGYLTGSNPNQVELRRFNEAGEPDASFNGTGTAQVTLSDSFARYHDLDLVKLGENQFVIGVAGKDGNYRMVKVKASPLSILEDSGQHIIPLTGITDGDINTQPLRVTATSSNLDLVATPGIDYSSNDTVGALTFAPTADQSGSTTITVTVEDGGMDLDLATAADNASFSRTFELIVNPVNDTPFFNLTPPAVPGHNVVATSHWSAEQGGNGHHYYLMSAPDNITWTQARDAAATMGGHLATTTSDHERELVGILTKQQDSQWAYIGGFQAPLASNYSEPAGGWRWVTGESFEGNGWNRSNGEPDEHLEHEDIMIMGDSHWSDGTDTPQLTSYVVEFQKDPMADRFLSHDALDQVLRMVDIVAGGGESQPLRVTASSSNSDLVSDPGIKYTSDETTGHLEFIPNDHQHGTTTLTITLEDGGLDDNLDTADDNASFSRTFEVFVQSCENQLPTLDAIDDLTIDVNTLATPLDGSIQWRAEDGGNDHWYKLIKNTGAISWSASQAAAEEMGGHLATVNSAAEDQFLAAHLLAPKSQWPHTVGPWIGGYQDQNSPDYSEPAGGWKWVTGEPMDFTKWSRAEPNNENGEHYIHYDHPNDGGNRWNDLRDQDPRPFSYIVEMSHGSALETVNLTGITDGGEKNQSLKVTATSSNTDLLPTPGVTYTSAQSTGLLNVTPISGQVGTSTVTVTVEDAGLDLDLATTDDNGFFSRTFDVTVNPAPNGEPIAHADSFDVLEDSTDNSLNVLANDTDPNGDPLTVTQISQPSAGGSVQLGSDGTLLYTPKAGFFGDDTFTYTIDDGNGGQDTAQVMIAVQSVNDAPSAIDDSFTLKEDSILGLDVLANDHDPDGGPLSVTEVSQPASGSVTITSGGTLLYSPTWNFVGNDSFSYAISDDEGATATAQVSIHVENVNDNPTAVGDRFTVNENSVDNQLDVLANDSIDPDKDETLTITSITRHPDFCSNNMFGANGFAGGMNGGLVGMGGGMGSLSGGGNSTGLGSGGNDNSQPGCDDEEQGTITIVDGSHLLYTPAPGFSGTDAFMYTVDDGNGGNASELVLIQVTNVNDAPVAIDDLYNLPGDDELHVLNVLSNDLDVDGDSLRITEVSIPNSGTEVTISPDQTQLIYRGPLEFEGMDQLSYTIEDNQGATATATVSVDVESIAHDPAAGDDLFLVEGDDEAVELDVLENDSNAPDANDLLQIIQVSSPSEGGTVSIDVGSDQLLYQPAEDFSGQETFTYMIVNNHGRKAVATVTIDVTQPEIFTGAVDDTFVNISQDIEEFTSLDVMKNDMLALDDMIQLLSVESPSNGTAMLDEMGETVLYKPAAGFFGTDQFTYMVRDLDGTQHQAQVTVQIIPTEPITKWASFTTVAMDQETGEIITEIPADESFDLVTFVQDVRPFMYASEAGVFAAYMDVLYTADTVQLEAEPVIEFSSFFSNVHSGDTSKLGVIDEVGGMQAGLKPLGNQPIELFRITFAGFNPGTAVFTTDPADLLPENSPLIFQPPTELGTDKLHLTETIVEITEPDPSRFLDVNDDDAVTPMDALQVINDLNYNGSRPVDEDIEGPEGEVTRGNQPRASSLDVNRDRYVSPLDALAIINYLNIQSRASASSGEGEGESVPSAITDSLLTETTQPSDATGTSQLQEDTPDLVQQEMASIDLNGHRQSDHSQQHHRINDVALADLLGEDDRSLESLLDQVADGLQN